MAASLFAPVSIDGGVTRGRRVLLASWCSANEPSLLAVALDSGTVLVLEEDGSLHDEVTRNRTSRNGGETVPTCLAWTSTTLQGGNVLLAVGWQDGTIMVWSLKDRMDRCDDDQHAGHPISFISFSPCATRIIAADGRAGVPSRQQEAAVLCVYKVDNKGRFNSICPYRKPAAGALTHGIFRTAEQKKKLITSAFAAADVPPFYYGGETGVILMGDDMGRCSEVIPSLGGAVAAMLYLQERDTLVVITKGSMLCTFKLTDNKPVPLLKSKLSVGREGFQSASWCGIGQLAIVSADSVVRVNDLLDDEENFVLSLAEVPNSEDDKLSQAKLTMLAYQPSRRLLAAGTKEGHIIVWRNTGGSVRGSPEMGWEALPAAHVDAEPHLMTWDPSETQLAVAAGTSLSLMPETTLRRGVVDDWSFVQQGASEVLLEHEHGAHVVLKTTSRIKGCDVHSAHILTWTGSTVEVYHFDDSATDVANPPGEPVLLSSFEHRCSAAVVFGEALFLSAPGRLDVTNFSGSVLATLPFSDAEGTPIAIHAAGRTGDKKKTVFLVAGTDKGYIKAWEVSRKEPRQHVAARKLGDCPITKVANVAIAADGSRLSASIEVQLPPPGGATKPKAGSAPTVPWSTDPKLYMLLIDSDSLVTYDFGQSGRVPNALFWETSDPKLLGVETRPAPKPVTAAAVPPPPGPPSAIHPLEVTTLFATPEGDVKLQNTVPIEGDHQGLMAVRVPHLYFLAPPATQGPFEHADADQADTDADETGAATASGEKPLHLPPSVRGCRLRRVVMRDFAGMEALDAGTRKALVDFSYYLTVGAMDEAHKAVKRVQSAAVWENMARMCVQTRRLDIADVCLGNMGHARGARAVRLAVEANTDAAGVIAQPEVCAAIIAVQLGMLKEAEQLYVSCGRYDLLNEFYQASGQWDKALEVAEANDRIHLKATHYTYARQLEAEGDTAAATKHFEESDTHRVEVPRMLFDAQLLPELKEFVDKTADKQLYKWWAQYAESNARFKEALTYYEKASDHLSIVRVLTFHNKLERAAEVVNTTNDSSAAYHLARQHETKANNGGERAHAQQAIQYYQRAGRFNHAIRLAKEHDLAGELNVMAISAPPKLMADSAKYFEDGGNPDRAVALYVKSGNIAKAAELCFKFSLFDQLSTIAEQLPKEADPALVSRCAEFFLDHGQFEKCVKLFAAGGECAKAIDLCIMHNIPLTEEMAEQLTPELGSRGAETADALNNLRLKVAKVLKRQGNFHLACKKYTQAGDKIKAMKCLLKSGDTQKISYFAGVSRNRDIYILAANYLQNLDWKADPDIVKNIVQFYSKAKAFDSLAAFFDSCAQVEIDDYRDYEKALAALREAHEWMSKARVQDKDSKLASLGERIAHVETFVRARKMVKSEPEETVKLCFELLEQQSVENALRVGDVYALMVEWFYSQGQMDQGYSLIEKMVARSIVLAPYLDQEMVAAICGAVGVAIPQDPQPAEPPMPAHADADEVGEAIEEDLDD